MEVRRFKRWGNYPNKYSETLAGEQSAVPSQNSPVPPAYDPSVQADMQQIGQLKQDIQSAIAMGEMGVYAPSGISIVRHTFDSRPPFAYDWYWQDKYAQGLSIQNGYTVPLGYILILRRVSLAIYPIAGDISDPIMSEGGDDDNTVFAVPQLSVLINGAAAPSWTSNDQGNISGVPLYDAFTAEQDIDMFVLANGGDTVMLDFPPVTTLDPGNLTVFNAYVSYYGTLLLATGRVLNQEVGNMEPQPVIAIPGQIT